MKTKSGQLMLSLVVMALWGSLYAVVKLGYSALGVSGVGSTLLFAGVRFTVCGGLIFLYCLLYRREDLKRMKGDTMQVLLSGLFAVVLHYGLIYLGMTITSGSKTSMLKQVGVLFYICVSPLFFPEDKLTARKLAGAGLGLFGIALMSLDGGGISFTIGDVLIVGSSFSIMFSNVISKRVLSRVDPIVSTGCSQLFGGVLLVAVGLASGGRLEMPEMSGWMVLVYIFIASIASYCLWYSILKKGVLSELFIIKFTESIFAGVFSAMLLGEDIFRWEYAAAVVLTVAGIFISNSTARGAKGLKRSA